MSDKSEIDLYEHFNQLREIIPEEDHALFGLTNDRKREETMRATAMRQLMEDDNRSDSETVFFFRSREDALTVYMEAMNLGLAPGEVTYDAAVDESFGVGQYALRFMPHIRDGKREILYKLYGMSMGGKVTPEMYREWISETDGGALVVEQGALAQMDTSMPGAQISGMGHPKGMHRMGGGDPVHGLTGQPSRDPGADPVHGLTQPHVGSAPMPEGPQSTVWKQGQAAAKSLEGKKLGDYVLNNMMRGDQGTGGNPGVHGLGGAAPASEGGDKSGDGGSNQLAEDLRQIAGGPTSIEELRSLLG